MGNRASYDAAGYTPSDRGGRVAGVLGTEFSERFVDAMRNRMVVSYHKYGPVARGYPDRVNALQTLADRVEKYRQTGNAEWLVDVANFAMIEFMHPSHAAAHFRPTDSDESPGRQRRDGFHGAEPNDPVDSAVERLRERANRGE